MPGGGEAARGAWARLLGLDDLVGLQVVVAPASPLCRAGWIGILGLDGSITASVPRAELRAPVAAALGGLTAEEAVRVDVVVPRLPSTRDVLGPTPLFFAPSGYVPAEPGSVEVVPGDEHEALLGSVPPQDLEESGLRSVTSPVFGSRTDHGVLVAACGYRCWPDGVAHLSVLTVPAHRRAGHGHRAAVAAIRHAVDAGLLPQWRARPAPSQALARSLGLVELGAQLNLEPA